MEQKWENGLCREFVNAIEKTIVTNSSEKNRDYHMIGKDVVDLFGEYFGESIP